MMISLYNLIIVSELLKDKKLAFQQTAKNIKTERLRVTSLGKQAKSLKDLLTKIQNKKVYMIQMMQLFSKNNKKLMCFDL